MSEYQKPNEDGWIDSPRVPTDNTEKWVLGVWDPTGVNMFTARWRGVLGWDCNPNWEIIAWQDYNYGQESPDISTCYVYKYSEKG